MAVAFHPHQGDFSLQQIDTAKENHNPIQMDTSTDYSQHKNTEEAWGILEEPEDEEISYEIVSLSNVQSTPIKYHQHNSKHELNGGDTKGHATSGWGQYQEPSTLYKELQATEESSEQERWVFSREENTNLLQ